MSDEYTGRGGADTLARAYAEEAVLTLAEIMGDATARKADRISAAAQILDRGYGKATQAVIALPSKRAVAQQLAHMSEEDLMATLLEARARRTVTPALLPCKVDVTAPEQAQSTNDERANPWD